MIKSKQILILLLAVAFVSTNFVAQVNKTTKFDFDYLKQTLTEEVNKILKITGIPSVSIALIKGDSIVWADAFGYANVKKKVLATSSTIYNTGSNFKFVTATAIMQLAELGKLNIDDPINDYLGESVIDDLSSEGKPVTFRHLLSHHSGLKGSLEIVPVWERKLPRTLEEVASEISVEEDPGKSYKYCNHCYALAGLIIEKVSGQSYQDYLVEHILKPLQIKSAGPLVPTPSMVEELALPYNLENNQAIPEYQKRFDVFPAGDIYLTCSEMANFLIAQLNDGIYKDQAILKPESVREMHKGQFGIDYYGLGTGIKQTDDEKFLNHAGGVPGFSSFFKIGTNSKTGVYIASNANNVHQILTAITNFSLKLLNGNENPEPLPSFIINDFKEIELPNKVLRKYVGEYQLKSDYFVSITLEDSKLYGQATGKNKFEMSPHEEDRFFIKKAYVNIDFNIENKKVVSFSIFNVDGKREAKKLDNTRYNKK